MRGRKKGDIQGNRRRKKGNKEELGPTTAAGCERGGKKRKDYEKDDGRG